MFTEDGYAGDEESIYKLKKWGVGEGSLNDTIFIATAVPLLVLHLYTFFASRSCDVNILKLRRERFLKQKTE